MLNTAPPKTPLNTLFIVLAIAFATFIVTIIALANSGDSEFIRWAQSGIPYADKVGHFVLVGLMSFFANLALSARRVTFASRQWLLGSALVLIVFTAEEFMQLGLTYRTFDLGDLTADFLGIFIFGRIAASIIKRLPSN